MGERFGSILGMFVFFLFPRSVISSYVLVCALFLEHRKQSIPSFLLLTFFWKERIATWALFQTSSSSSFTVISFLRYLTMRRTTIADRPSSTPTIGLAKS